MSNSVYIKLSESDINICQKVAKQYADRAEKYANYFTKGKKNNYEYKLIGALGEYAVCKLLCKPWKKMDLKSRHSGDIEGYEIKSTSKMNGDLIVPLDNDKTRPYILCVVKSPWVEIVGFAWPNEIFSENNEVHTHGLMRPSYIIKRNTLNHIGLLK